MAAEVVEQAKFGEKSAIFLISAHYRLKKPTPQTIAAYWCNPTLPGVLL
jgi:hypothetical protein